MSLSKVSANSNICIFRLFQDLLPAGRRQTWRHHHVATDAGLDLKCAATACMTPPEKEKQRSPSKRRKTLATSRCDPCDL